MAIKTIIQHDRSFQRRFSIMAKNGHLAVWKSQLVAIEKRIKNGKAEAKHYTERKKQVRKQITNYLKKSKRRKK